MRMASFVLSVILCFAHPGLFLGNTLGSLLFLRLQASPRGLQRLWEHHRARNLKVAGCCMPPEIGKTEVNKCRLATIYHRVIREGSTCLDNLVRTISIDLLIFFIDTLLLNVGGGRRGAWTPGFPHLLLPVAVPFLSGSCHFVLFVNFFSISPASHHFGYPASLSSLPLFSHSCSPSPYSPGHLPPCSPPLKTYLEHCIVRAIDDFMAVAIWCLYYSFYLPHSHKIKINV